LAYKRRCWGLISERSIRTVKIFPISHPLLAQDFSSFCEILLQLSLINPFSLHSIHSFIEVIKILREGVLSR
jgi:hypothetical protein